MKNLLLLLSCCAVLLTHASGADSTFQRHQLSLSVANAMNQEFFDGPGHKPTAVPQVIGFFSGSVIKATYLPLYTAHVQVHYSLGITPAVRIETGIGYLLGGLIIKYNEQFTENIYIVNSTSREDVFSGNITLPLYVKFMKTMPHGVFTCSVGPDFTLPVHSSIHDMDRVIGAENYPNEKIHQRWTTDQTGQYSTMGLYLKLGYEKAIRQNLSINAGPAFDFYQLVQFHPGDWFQYGSGYYPYQYYVGLDVAVNFGLKK